jgi:hypothetical protein
VFDPRPRVREDTSQVYLSACFCCGQTRNIRTLGVVMVRPFVKALVKVCVRRRRRLRSGSTRRRMLCHAQPDPGCLMHIRRASIRNARRTLRERLEFTALRRAQEEGVPRVSPSPCCNGKDDGPQGTLSLSCKRVSPPESAKGKEKMTADKEASEMDAKSEQDQKREASRWYHAAKRYSTRAYMRHATRCPTRGVERYYRSLAGRVLHVERPMRDFPRYRSTASRVYNLPIPEEDKSSLWLPSVPGSSASHSLMGHIPNSMTDIACVGPSNCLTTGPSMHLFFAT